jgi:hypothetical protein
VVKKKKIERLLLSSLYIGRGEVRKATEHVQEIPKIDPEDQKTLQIVESMQERVSRR